MGGQVEKKNGKGRLVDVVPQTMWVIHAQLEKTRSQVVKTLEKKGSKQVTSSSSAIAGAHGTSRGPGSAHSSPGLHCEGDKGREADSSLTSQQCRLGVEGSFPTLASAEDH